MGGENRKVIIVSKQNAAGSSVKAQGDIHSTFSLVEEQGADFNFLSVFHQGTLDRRTLRCVDCSVTATAE